MNDFVEITSTKRQKKRERNIRNKKQKENAGINKKKLLKQLENFFYEKERKNIGWWFLLGY